MKIFKLLVLLSGLFFSGNHLFGQPGEESDKKYNIHEIKLHEREDGSKAGAIVWNTALPDSVQKFVVRNLSIMEPVQVLLQTLSPNDKVTLQFVKEKWDQPESSISAKGKKMGKKILRTYKTAAMYIKADKPNVPYIILVQVGKKFPTSTSPFVRITKDKREYEEYLKNKGKTTLNKTDEEAAVIPVVNNESGGGNTPNNSSLLYIIIGLLALMVAFLGYFVFFRKGSKKILLFVLLIGLCINTLRGQSDAPTPISTEEINNLLGLDDVLAPQDGDIPIIEYGSPEWYDENPIPIVESEGAMTEDEFKKMVLDMREDYLNFKRDFVDDMPGEDTEDGNRTIPPEISEADLNRLRRRIRDLEEQVELLSNRDQEYLPEDPDEEPPITYCDEDTECVACIKQYNSFAVDIRESFRELNRIMLYTEWVLQYGIAVGNALANSAPGMGLGWHKQLIAIQNGRSQLWVTYHAKYNELLTRIDLLVNQYEECASIYETPMSGDMRTFLKDKMRMENPEISTPNLIR